MNPFKFLQSACALSCVACTLALSSAYGQESTPIPSPAPEAEIVLNAEQLKHDEPLQATFKLNKSISRPFKAYAVLILPVNKMLNALTLNKPLKPVVAYATKLDAPFVYPLINRIIPNGAPPGRYEVLAGFFDPAQPVTGRNAAFLLASGIFNIATPIPTPLPDLTGEWRGEWEVTDPLECEGWDGEWEATIEMSPEGRLSGHFETTGDLDIEGTIDGYYDGTIVQWEVDDDDGPVEFRGTVSSSGTIISGTFWDGPECPDGDECTSGDFGGALSRRAKRQNKEVRR